MLKLTGSFDYYPTPDELLDKITQGMDWGHVSHALEPSAGKGNIAEYLKRKMHEIYSFCGETRHTDIDCVEIEPELRSILIGKGFRVVQDDFLTLHTYKHYDLIFMNPPFSEGAKHLLKALEVQSISGGSIICILNAETIRNPYTNERNLLTRKLDELQADVTYYQDAFKDAENPTDVEVAVVKVTVPEPTRHTTIFETLREKKYEEYERLRENNELAPSDLVLAYVEQYNREIEWGLRLYDEFLDLQAGAMDGTNPLSLNILKGYGNHSNFTVNEYVTAIRRKYWDKLFKTPDFVKKMTCNLYDEYLSQINTFVAYDFSYFNIKTVMIDITKNLVRGVEECIIKLFDELSYQHAYDDDLKHNIHYYDGWRTNKSWYINKKVILPYVRSWDDIGHKFEYHWNVRSKLGDIEKALNYLDCGRTEEVDLGVKLQVAERHQISRNIDLKYFMATFYKKGTCHIEFKDERLLKKLNIFGSQRKGWLPKGYGRKHYKDMEPDERKVIDSFEGAVAYEQTVSEAQYFLFDASTSIPALHA